MDQPDAGFEKIEETDNRMHGPRKLLVCGFPAGDQPTLTAALAGAGLADLEPVWALASQATQTLGNLMALPGNTGAGEASTLPRAVIMAGITENELHLLMAAHREAGLARPLWAALTPTSEGWTLQALLDELSEERRAMEKK
jgi:Domain of unknown function (DUF3783)